MSQAIDDRACCYAFLGKPKVESSNVVITGIISVSHQPTFMLYDLGSTFYFVSVYFTSSLDMMYESIIVPIYVSTPVGDFLLVDQVYQSYVVFNLGYDT